MPHCEIPTCSINETDEQSDEEAVHKKAHEELSNTNIKDVDGSGDFQGGQRLITLLEKIDSKQDSILEIIKAEKQQNLSNVVEGHKSCEGNTKEDDEGFQQLIKKLKYSTSMKEVLDNDLVKDVFNESKEGNTLVCFACQQQSASNSIGIPVEDWDYEQKAGDNMSYWFTKCKKAR